MAIQYLETILLYNITRFCADVQTKWSNITRSSKLEAGSSKLATKPSFKYTPIISSPAPTSTPRHTLSSPPLPIHELLPQIIQYLLELFWFPVHLR